MAINTDNCVQCNDDCSASLPLLSNGCKPTYLLGQLENMYVSGQPFGDYSAVTGWDPATEHANADFSTWLADFETRTGTGSTFNQIALPDAIRCLCIEGGVSSESSEIEVCKGKTIKTDLKVTYEGTIKDLSYQNWEFLRNLSACNPELYFLFATRDRILGGDCCGDSVQGFINFDLNVPNDRNALIEIAFSLTIEQKGMPCWFPNCI